MPQVAHILGAPASAPGRGRQSEIESLSALFEFEESIDLFEDLTFSGQSGEARIRTSTSDRAGTSALSASATDLLLELIRHSGVWFGCRQGRDRKLT